MATETRTSFVAVNGSWGVFRAELGRWLGRRGVFHLVFWLVLIDGFLYFTVVGPDAPFGGLGFESLVGMLTVFPMIAAIILTEAMVIGEYHSGIAAWTVSKPVPRTGYIVGKLAAFWVGFGTVAIFIPALVAYWWLPKVQPYRFVIPEAPPLSRFLATLLLLWLVTGFFIVLTGVLGSLIRRRGVVALISLLAFAILRISPSAVWDGWYRFTAAGLITAEPEQWNSVTVYVYGDPLGATSAVVWTILSSAVLAAGAALVYRRLEL